MPTVENSETGGGRVTRSLRKRLTSIDTDSSSRPGTPLLSSLQTLQETVTPSKRTTRRTSMSTPVPTPSKGKGRIEVSEVVNSPARRNTRRRSLSTHEQEDIFTPLKVKEPAFDVVKEEETLEKSPELKSKGTQRLSPISTLIRQGERSRSATPNSEKTRILISPEVSPQVLKHMKHSKVMLKKEHIEETNSSAQKSTTKIINKQPVEKEETPWKIIPNTTVSSPETIQSCSPEKIHSSKQTRSKQTSVVEKQSSPPKALDSSLKSDDAKSDLNTSIHHTPSRKDVDGSPKEGTLTGNETTLSATEIQNTPKAKKRGRPCKIKNVGFNNTAEEDEEKSVFPKTPGLTKSKSYILDSSKPDVNESISKSENKSEDSNKETEKPSVKEDAVEDDNEIGNSKTPYKLKLNSIESSTPIQSTSVKKSKDESDQKDTSIKDCEGSKEHFAFPKSWSHSVSGTVNDFTKIDGIESEERLEKKLEEEKAMKKRSSNSSKASKQKRSVLDDSDEDLVEEDDLLLGEEDEDEDEDEDEEEEEREREKSMFVDDEAMEVADGEESMDSEERAYLEENEIPVYAESIGSEDTVEDECEEEADEEDAAFVVSDTEEILHGESDSDDGKKITKKYKRIVRNVDSSDEESVSGKEKDVDFCLIVDSSVDTSSNVSRKEKLETKSNSESLNDPNKVEQETETLPGEKSLSVLMKSVKSHGEMKSRKNKEDVEGDEINAEEGEERRIEADNIAEIATDTCLSDEKLSKKERKSLKNRKSVRAEEENRSTVAFPEDSIEQDEDTSVNNPNESLQTKEQVQETDDGTDTDADQKNMLSKKDRKSLSLGKAKEAGRKSLMTPKKNNGAHNEDKQVNSPDKRKSLKKQEVFLFEGLPNEMEMEGQRSTLDDTDTTRDIEVRTSKLSKKERKSLADASQDNSMCSPQKRKSLKSDEENQEAYSEFSDTTSSRNKLPKKERKSLNSSHTVQELNDQDVTDVEMIDIEKSIENETEKTVTKDVLENANASLNKSYSEKWQNVSEDSGKESEDGVGHESLNTEHDEVTNLSGNESSQKSVSDPDKVQGARVQNDEEKKSNVNSPLRSDNEYSLKSPEGKNNSPLKQPRKSFNKSIAAELSNDHRNRVSENSEENDQIEDGEESVDNNPSNVSQNSLNTSKNKKRKSLKRSSTEELSNTEECKLERTANKSKSEMSILFVEDDSETETISELEVSSRVTEDKSQNSSRINRKSMNKSICNKKEEAVERSLRKSIHSASNSENEEEDDEKPNAESDDENEENVAERSKVMEFLGEEESKCSSPQNLDSSRRQSLHKSKLDETFHLESSNSSVFSRRDSLHRNVLKKSLNQSKLLSESIKKSEFKSDDDANGDADISAMFSDEEEEVEIVKNVLPDRGLSVSLSGIECKKKKPKSAEKQVHKSFTIGVSLRHAATCADENDNISSPDSVESLHCNVSMSERDDLEKIENIQSVGPYKPRSSLSKIGMEILDENIIKSKSKRFSLYIPQEGVSQSFVENLAEENKKLHSKRNRKSNSFCGVIEPCEEPEVQPEESEKLEPPKSQTHSSEISKSEVKTDIQRILSRCDEILEAANRAKRDAKLNAKKTKVKKPKWMNNEENVKEEEEVKIPLVSKKEIKRKEKMKKELAKAIKHSTAMLKTIDPKLVKKFKAAPEVKPEPKASEEPPISSKRLPADFLDELEEAPKPKKKKTKEIESTPPSDKENSKRSSDKTQYHSSGITEGEKKKKKHSKEIFETASGTVIVEPSTPTKLRFQNGFRESPKTPVGFKIEDINDREKSKKRFKKLFTASDAFEEQDSSNSNLKRNSKKSKKRKFHIEEPIYSLPKTQWTSSGIFVEEDIYTVHHPLANSTATQFMVSSLGGSKKSKSSKVVSSATLSTALSFKKNALFNEKVKRESARSLIHRQERKHINNRY